MKDGTQAVLWIGDESYKISRYKINERVEDYFCGTLDLTFQGKTPDIEVDEPYSAKLVVNDESLWYFPWVWFKEIENTKIASATHGGIFCPQGLSPEEEVKYDSINLIVASDACYSMTAEVWKNLMMIFADWLKDKSIPQFKEFLDLADEIEIDEDEDDLDEDEDENEDKNEDEDDDD
jgi:hypothetical protein